MKESIIAELNQHATDELRHADMVAQRILQLGGTPLLNPKDFDVLAILQDSIKGEQCAIETYSKLVDITKDKDIVTYDIVSQILADEVEHEEDLQGLYEDITEFKEQIKESLK